MGSFENAVERGDRQVSKLTQTASTTVAVWSQRRAGIQEEITSVRLVNLGDSITLYFSIDGGSNYRGILPHGIHNVPTNSIHEIYVKTLTSSTTYDLIWTVKP